MAKRARKKKSSIEPWSPEELAVFRDFETPHDVQTFLSATPYSDDPIYRSPRSVIRDRKAHCFDGAVFAAAALEQLGYPPLLVDFLAVRDDDHVIAVYRRDGFWGAVAQSNFSTLRFREPVYWSLRELVMSYFDFYFNTIGELTLRGFSKPVDLGDFDVFSWRTKDATMKKIAGRLTKEKHEPVIDQKRARRLKPVDDRSFRAGMLGANPAGLYDAGTRTI